MNIQLISKKKTKKIYEYNFEFSNLSQPKTFDSYDINIIDLQAEEIWRTQSDSVSSVDDINDFATLKVLIESSKKAKNIIFLPENYTFLYDYYSVRGNATYHKNYILKDKIWTLKKILEEILPTQTKNGTSYTYDLEYEKSKTKCGDGLVQSDFYFSKNPYKSEITLANDSQKPTTIKILKNCFITTLNLNDVSQNFKGFLGVLGLLDKKEAIPQWLIDFDCFDDEKQKDKITKNNKKIEDLHKEIACSREILEKNLHYKTVLSETGEVLVGVVFEMLEKLLNYDLSNFEDKKDEDFRITIDDTIFIGEIKGINTNVKKVNVSQVDTHCKNCEDEFEDEVKKIKGLLIINHQRDKNIIEREVINLNTISLAEKYEILIIQTIDLLKIYEQYIVGLLTTERIVEQFKTQTGLIDISKI